MQTEVPFEYRGDVDFEVKNMTLANVVEIAILIAIVVAAIAFFRKRS